MSEWRAEVVFCDDVRQEANGKHILIGVYGADLVPVGLPVTFALWLWVRLSGLELGRHRFAMELTDPAGNRAMSMNGAFEVDTPDAPVIMATGGMVTVATTGFFILSLTIDGKEQTEIGRLKVSPPPQPPQGN